MAMMMMMTMGKLAARGESPASHRGPSKVKPKPRSARGRREEGKYREYSTHRGQRPAPPMAGCIGGRTQRDSSHGLLGVIGTAVVLVAGVACGTDESGQAPAAGSSDPVVEVTGMVSLAATDTDSAKRFVIPVSVGCHNLERTAGRGGTRRDRRPGAGCRWDAGRHQ